MTQHNIHQDIKGNAGFTLIELSIVLVIIGLIVGGILTGQDLIKAAEQRATLAQVEKYNTAVNTFRNKFGGIPGDLAQASASSFGLFALSNATTTGQGDGNGLIDGGGANTVAFLGETPTFWCHLSQAGLIDGSFAGATSAGCSLLTASTGAVAQLTSSNVMNYMPIAKLGRSNYLNVGEAAGVNYYILGGFNNDTAATGVYATGQGDYLNPLESYSMDKKVDDGLPTTGSIQALSLNAAALTTTTLGTVNPTNGAVGAAVCATPATTPTAYNVTVISPQCSLRFRFN